MKISAYIEELKAILKTEGDLDCYYAVDEEGNGYGEILYSCSILYKEKKHGDIENIAEEDFENGEYDFEDYEKVICVN